VEVLFDRMQHRGMERPPIEREQLLRWVGMFQVPTPDEIALFDKSSTLGV
jgi:hypothetical protein